MILGKKSLLKRLTLPTGDPKSIVVTPLIAPGSAISEDSIDLRLGNDFFVTRSDRLAVNVPGHAHGAEYQRPVHVPFGHYLVLPGHQTVLASTLEFIKLPPDVAGMVLTKSSWARTFITVETAPWVHPSYRGCLTLEIANVSETPLTLYPGHRIAQLIFFKVAATSNMQDKPSGSYIGPTKPEPPNFSKPKQVLKEELGLTIEVSDPMDHS